MKKIIKGLLSVFVFVAIACLGIFADNDMGGTPDTSTQKSITSLNVSVSGNRLLVGGKTEDGMLAVAIAVYDKSGKNLVTMQTAGVDNNNNYEGTIEVSDGSYMVKAADYEGGNYLTKNVTVGDAKKEETKEDNKNKDKKGKGKKQTEEKNRKENPKQENEQKQEEKNNQNQENSDDSKIKTTEENTAKEIHFPKTWDSGIGVLMISILGIIASLISGVILKLKKC